MERFGSATLAVVIIVWCAAAGAEEPLDAHGMDTDTIGFIAILIVGAGILIAAARWKNAPRDLIASKNPPTAESIQRRRL